MTAAKIDKFGGMLPGWDDQLLPDGQAALSRDAYLHSGALIGWRKPKLLRTLSSPSIKSVYRVPFITGANDQANLDIAAPDSIWLEFADRHTNVLRSPVVNDTHKRFYTASPSDVPRYNTYARIAVGSPFFKLGIPAPECAPTVSVAGGGDDTTLGLTIDNSSSDQSYGTNRIYLIKITPDADLTLDTISILAQFTDATARFTGVLYSDVAGVPQVLQARSAETVGATSGQNVVVAFITPPLLSRGSSYWIGVMFDKVSTFRKSNNTGTTGVVVTQPYDNGPPTTIGSYTAGQPDLRMFASLTNTAAVLASRGYCYTYVSDYGEEGPPSPTTIVTGWSNATWTVGLFQPAAADQGVDRNITKKRIYRTVSASTGLTTYFFVAEVTAITETYVDTSEDDIVSLNDQLTSTLYYGPPTDLQGVAQLPNGVMVGFKTNELWFSEAYLPHAWNPTYVLTVDYPIVGIGITGQTVVVCTQGNPAVAQGVNPASMALTKVQLPEPCISRGSILSTDNGVLYASPNGLINVTQNAAGTNVTEGWITRERWRELTPPKFVHAIKLASSYFAFGVVDGVDTTYAQQGFTLEMSDADRQSFSIWPQPGGHRLGFCKLSAPNALNIDNVQLDVWSGVGLLIQSGGLYYYDFADQEPELQPYLWRSKVYQKNAKCNYAAFRAFFTVPPNTPAQSAARNTSEPQTLAAAQYLIVRVYADDVLRTTREVRSSGELLRIKSGFKAEKWQFEMEGRVKVHNMQVATSVKELAVV